MERTFRSRGIRIICNDGHTCLTEKLYYEPDKSCEIKNAYLTGLQEKGLLTLFEYSVIDDQIDTYNYHVELFKDDYTEIYSELSTAVIYSFDRIKDCFGESMRNYTVGYRLNGSNIVQQSFYFYPTIWKGNRYGIKGITEPDVIHSGIKKFSEFIAKENKISRRRIINFAKILYKFKGISVHPSKNNLGYKIYGRVNNNILKVFLLENYSYNIDQNQQYGECVLVALRIVDGLIQGINIYYLR